MCAERYDRNPLPQRFSLPNIRTILIKKKIEKAVKKPEYVKEIPKDLPDEIKKFEELEEICREKVALFDKK